MSTTNMLNAGPRPGIEKSHALAVPAANVVLFTLLWISFALAACRVAAIRPLWMDEVLAVWTARLPTIGAIWDALNRGADYAPPLYHAILHGILALGGNDVLMLRLPSIVAIVVVATAAFILMRRRYSAPIAMLAMALCLTSSLFWFAVQARPYALVTACFAVALTLWDIPAAKAPSWSRAAAIAALLTSAVGMHFYATLLAASVGLMEMIWTIVHRRIRWLFMAAIGLACSSVFLWLPLMQSIIGFNSGETSAANYYAQPTLILLAATYPFLLLGYHPIFFLSPLTALLIAITLSLLSKSQPNDRPEVCQKHMGNLDIIVAVTCAIPLLIFLFSFVVTHTYNFRYVIATVLGFSILTARLIAKNRWATIFSYFIVMVAVGLSLHTFTTTPYSQVSRALTLINRATSTLPIATGDGLRFFELRESANVEIAKRLVFVKSPPGTVSPDPTNARAVERWARIDPGIATADFKHFIDEHPRFLLFHDSGAVDLLPSQLEAHGYVINVLAREGDAYLAEVKSSQIR